MVHFFELKTPRDMLDKARREHQRLSQHVDIDTVFNFFVTAYHIWDYVKECNPDLQSNLEAFAKDEDIRVCRALCHNAKHLRLTKLPQPPTRVVSSYVGAGMVGEMMVGGGDTWLLEVGGDTVEVEELATSVVRKWESFFEQNSI